MFRKSRFFPYIFFFWGGSRCHFIFLNCARLKIVFLNWRWFYDSSRSSSWMDFYQTLINFYFWCSPSLVCSTGCVTWTFPLRNMLLEKGKEKSDKTVALFVSTWISVKWCRFLMWHLSNLFSPQPLWENLSAIHGILTSHCIVIVCDYQSLV